MSCKKPGSSQSSGGTESVRPSSTTVLSAAAEKGAPPPTKRPPKKSPGAGQMLSISDGKYVAGSMPGDRGRDSTLEPAMLPVDLGSFEIDRLPYPNDPAQPPRTDLTRSQAQDLCVQRGQRLCSELEWERACKGPDLDAYASGEGFDPACAKSPSACASGYDVLAMGFAMREWTSSSIEPIDKDDRAAGALRGGIASAVDTDHRCARREPADPGAHGPDIGFRCCKGAVNSATISRPKPLQTFKRVQLDSSQVNAMFKSVPQLAALGSISFFKDPDDVTLVTAKGDGGKGAGIMTTNPIMWSPDLGEEILVLTGKGSSGSSFVAAFHRLPDDRYRLASSFIFEGDNSPVILAFNGWVKTRLTWSSCWGCLGEEGAVIYRKDRRVVIEQN